METIWFCIVAVMVAAYVLLDGFDLGAGVIHLLVARGDRERRSLIASIGPVWDGNEVWLLAAGGTLYFAFPALYAAGFSGFYLALMVVLWLLILRGISIEFRSHLKDPLWRSFWDTVFCLASALLIIFYGAAIGNVVRGVPLDKDGYFFAALWTNFLPGAHPGVLDWYTVLTGVTAFVTLTLHGALWVALKTSGEVAERARRIGSATYWAVCLLAVGMSIASFAVQSHLSQAFDERPWQWIFPVVAAAGLIGVRLCSTMRLDLAAFLSSCVFITGLLLSAVFGLYPLVLPAVPDASLSLTIHNSAAPLYGLRVGLWWWIPGFALAIAYTAFTYRHFRARVHIAPEIGDIDDKIAEKHSLRDEAYSHSR